MLEILIMGTILGWGAAIPIGPINLEVVRRNLQWGTPVGLTFGLGACSADLIYLLLLSYGVSTILTDPLVLKIVGLMGALILAFFGFSALTQQCSEKKFISQSTSLINQYLSGLALTLSNPMTILFWASISSQVVTLTIKHPHAVIFAGIGVVIGTVSWIIGLNFLIHITKHKISDHIINILNKLGGVILLGFAGFSIYYLI